MKYKNLYLNVAFILLYLLQASNAYTQNNPQGFRVIAFYTAKQDLAHISFVYVRLNR